MKKLMNGYVHNVTNQYCLGATSGLIGPHTLKGTTTEFTQFRAMQGQHNYQAAAAGFFLFTDMEMSGPVFGGLAQ